MIKVADFGLSIDVSAERPVTRAGTLDYMVRLVGGGPHGCCMVGGEGATWSVAWGTTAWGALTIPTNSNQLQPTPTDPLGQAPEVLICPDKRRPEENKEKVLLAYTPQV